MTWTYTFPERINYGQTRLEMLQISLYAGRYGKYAFAIDCKVHLGFRIIDRLTKINAQREFFRKVILNAWNG